jgi:hypothetical protein
VAALEATEAALPIGARAFVASDAGGRSTWFKGAVFYELMVRSFNDSNGDGIGDIPGVVEKFDYLQWLGDLSVATADLPLTVARGTVALSNPVNVSP